METKTFNFDFKPNYLSLNINTDSFNNGNVKKIIQFTETFFNFLDLKIDVGFLKQFYFKIDVTAQLYTFKVYFECISNNTNTYILDSNNENLSRHFNLYYTELLERYLSFYNFLITILPYVDLHFLENFLYHWVITLEESDFKNFSLKSFYDYFKEIEKAIPTNEDEYFYNILDNIKEKDFFNQGFCFDVEKESVRFDYVLFSDDIFYSFIFQDTEQ